MEAGAIQAANIVNSTLNNTVIKIKGESMNNQVKTDIRDMAAEQRRQGETVEELAVDLVNEQQILGETLNTLQTEQRDIAAEQKIQGETVIETMEAGFSTNQIELGDIAGEQKRQGVFIESMNDRLNTGLDRLNTYITEGRKDAAEQKRQGNLKQAMQISLGVIIAVIIRVILWFFSKIWQLIQNIWSFYSSCTSSCSVLWVHAVPLAISLGTVISFAAAITFSAISTSSVHATTTTPTTTTTTTTTTKTILPFGPGEFCEHYGSSRISKISDL